jgi:transposase, IS5 family
MRFIGLALHDPVPDAKTIWAVPRATGASGRDGAPVYLVRRAATGKGWLAMGGQIVDATVIAARRPRLTQAEKEAIKGGGTPADWKPARRAQIDHDGRWTIKRGNKRVPAPGAGHQRQIEIAVPMFGYKNHVGLDREHGLLGATPSPTRRLMTAASSARCSTATTLRARCGPTPPIIRRPTWPARAPWSEAAIPAQKTQRQEDAGAPRPRQRHPRPDTLARRARLRRPEMPARARRAHRWHSPRRVKIGLANLAYNFSRLTWLNARAAPA